MKKSKSLILLVMLLILGLTLMACNSDSKEPASSDKGGEETPSDNGDQGKTEDPIHLTFATQEVGTGAYQYASAIAGAFTKGLGDNATIDLTTESPGGVGAPIIIENEQADIIMSNAGPAKWSVEEGVLDSPPTKSVRVIAGGLGRDFLNVLFTQDFVDKTGIESVEELVEKQHPVRIAIKNVGSLGNLACMKLLEAFDLTVEDIEDWGGEVIMMSGDNIKSYLQDGKADMTVDHIAAGQANTTELCMTTDMFFPQLSDETLAKLGTMGFSPVTIEANTWNGQTEAIKSVGSQQVILVHESMSDDLAYKLAQSLIENREDLATQIAALANLDPEEAWKPEVTGAEIHPGALKYFEDAGYVK